VHTAQLQATAPKRCKENIHMNNHQRRVLNQQFKYQAAVVRLTRLEIDPMDRFTNFHFQTLTSPEREVIVFSSHTGGAREITETKQTQVGYDLEAETEREAVAAAVKAQRIILLSWTPNKNEEYGPNPKFSTFPDLKEASRQLHLMNEKANQPSEATT